MLRTKTPAEHLAAHMEAAKHMDWMQVVLNGGPPCFHLDDDGTFCGRAEAWDGHKDGDPHNYVPLDALLSRIAIWSAAPPPEKEIVRHSKTGVYKVNPLKDDPRYWEVHFVNTREEAMALMEGAEMHGGDSNLPLGGYCLPVNEETVKETGCYGMLVFLMRSLEVIVHECVHAADFTMAHQECTEENVDEWHEKLATAASNLFNAVVHLRTSHL